MTKHWWSFFVFFFKQYRLSSKVDLNYWIQTYVVLLEEYFPPFRRQYPRFLLFCPFKHASFGYSSPAVLSFLLRQNGEGGGGGWGDPMSWANRTGNPPENVQRDQRYDKKNQKKTQPNTSLLTEAPVAAAAPGRSKIKNGVWGNLGREKGGGSEEVSHSLTHHSWCCARADGPSLASGSDCTIINRGSTAVAQICSQNRFTLRKTSSVNAIL